MFKITGGKGFHINYHGYNISVQFGCGNYCSQNNTDLDPRDFNIWESEDAEIAVWDKSGYLDPDTLEPSGDVKGWCTVEDFMQILMRIANK